jgi:hypothetical protein
MRNKVGEANSFVQHYRRCELFSCLSVKRVKIIFFHRTCWGKPSCEMIARKSIYFFLLISFPFFKGSALLGSTLSTLSRCPKRVYFVLEYLDVRLGK